MSYSTVEKALAGYRDLHHDNSIVTVCLGSKPARNAVPELYQLQITDALAEDFLVCVADELRSLSSKVAKGDIVLTPYDASMPQDRHEIEVHTPEAGSRQTAIIDSLADLARVPVYDGDDDTVKNLIFHVMAVQPDGRSPIYLFRRSTKNKELSKSKKMIAFFREGAFDTITEKVFIFDNVFDVMWIEGTMLILHKDGYHRIFDFFEEVFTHAQGTIQKIKSLIPIENADRFELDCMSNPVALTKLRAIANRPYLPKLTIDDLETLVREQKLPIEIKTEGDEKRLVYNSKERWSFLRLLDDGFVTSPLTQTNYEATAKRPR